MNVSCWEEHEKTADLASEKFDFQTEYLINFQTEYLIHFKLRTVLKNTIIKLIKLYKFHNYKIKANITQITLHSPVRHLLLIARYPKNYKIPSD